jgi:5-methylcytosine-specific restriction endonuclease McrA
MSVGLEIDHIIPFAEGGAASLENLVRLCKRHHLQKTHDGYRLIRIEPRRLEPKNAGVSADGVRVERSDTAPTWSWRAPPDSG